MIPLAIPNLAGNEAKYLQACVDENFVSTVGRFVSEFETLLAKKTGYKHAVCVSQGTTGLHAALTAVGVDTHDLVIIPALTFIASANAVAHCKADPWILDVTQADWTLDPELLLTALKNECVKTVSGDVVHRATGRRISAIMPVHTMGHPPDMDAIMSIARDWEIPVVSDAAAALGNSYKSKPIGDTGADLSVMSFNGNKIITTGGGGVILGQDDKMMKLIRHLTTTARNGPDYDHDMVGFNYRMTNIQAAVGVAQIELIDQFLEAKLKIASNYENAWRNIDGAINFPSSEWGQSNHWFSGVFLPHHSAKTVADLRKHLRSNGIDARPFWKPIHLQTPYQNAPTYLSGVTEQIWEQILPLPCSTQLTESEQLAVVSAVKSFFAH